MFNFNQANMRKFTAFLGLIGLLIFQACEGPQGPAGIDGVDGVDGVNILGSTYEVEIDFTDENNYAEFFEFTEPLIDGDALLVYMLEENPAELGTFGWRLLPQTFYLEQGVLVYNFDYTVNDFSIFLDNSPIEFSSLPAYYTTGVVFRAVVLPSDLISARVDYSDYEGTMKLLDIEEEDFIKLSPKN